MLRGDCNIQCPFCYQDIFQQQGSFDFSLERVRQALDEGRRHGYEEVYISGGEPTIHEDLPGVVRLCRSLGFGKVKIMTNGMRLGSAAYADALAGAGLTGVAFSLHGHDAAVHERHTGRTGSFSRLVAGLSHLVAHHQAVDVEVNTVVTAHNIGSLDELAGFVASLGVGELHLQHVVPSTPAAREMAPGAEQASAAIRRVIDRCPEGLHLSLAFFPHCWLRGYEDQIPDFDFTVPFLSNCPAMFDGWKQALLSAKVVTDECRECDDFKNCRGFWKTD